MELNILQNIGKNIWIYDAEPVKFYTVPFTTRMTVVRLESGDLWIHSPSKIIDGLKEELIGLGNVKYLISPNKIHHLYMQDWQSEFSDSIMYSSPGLESKRKDLKFKKCLDDLAELEWAEEIGQMNFTGSSVMEEIIFFHKMSNTLILTDLIENFPENHVSGFKKFLCRCAGVLEPNGKTPIDWRLTFKKAKAYENYLKMMEWNFDKIIFSHGNWIKENGKIFAEKSFSWTYK